MSVAPIRRGRALLTAGFRSDSVLGAWHFCTQEAPGSESIRCDSPAGKLLLILHVLCIQVLFSVPHSCPLLSGLSWSLASLLPQLWSVDRTDPNPLSPPCQPGSPGRVALGMTHLWAPASPIVLVTKRASIFLYEPENDLSRDTFQAESQRQGKTECDQG